MSDIITTPTIETTYMGQLRTSSTHIKSGSQLGTDAPIDNNGLGMDFSPTDLVATALATCMLTIMGIAAESRSVELPKAKVLTEKVMGSAPRRISEIRVLMSFEPNTLTAAHRQSLEAAARACPVAKSLSDLLIQEVHFEWGE